MQVLTPATVLVLCAMASPAFPQSAAEAVKSFGLIGTWSEDCARDREVIRMTFSLTLSGAARRTEVAVLGPNTSQRVFTDYEITSAIRVAEDRIKLTSMAFSRRDTHLGPLPLPDSQEGVYEKSGNTIRVIDNRALNSKVTYAKSGFYCDQSKGTSICGSTARPTTPVERCANDIK
jgi:hypothetical protein